MGLRLGSPEHLEGGEAGHHVEEVPGQPLQVPGLRLIFSLVVWPTKAMKRGIRGTVTAMITAEIQSAPKATTITVTGTITARKTWGK